MKKRWFIALVAMMLVLAACGGDGEGTDTTAEPGTDTTQGGTDTTADGGGGEEITLRIFAGNVGAELQSTQEIADAFMAENPDITVEVVSTPDFVEDRLGVYLQLFEAQSSEGDVFQIDVIWPGDLAEHFVDLNEYGGAEEVANHFPAIVENNTVDGKLVAIPWFTDAGLLYYRTDLLEKYNLEPPETWAELEAAAQTIQDGERAEGNQDFWGYVFQGNAYEGLTCNALEWVASAGGGSIIEPDGTITIANEAAIDMINQAAGWVGTISPPGVTAYGEEDSRGVWQAGNAAFMRNWPYAYSLGNADDSEIKGLFDVSPLPGATAGQSAATLGGWQLAVSAYSEHPEEAAQLAFFMASEQEQKRRAIEYSLNPTIESLYDDPEVLEASPFFGSLFDVFTNAVARPSTATAPSYADVSSLFFNSVHSVLTGSADAEDALLELELDLEDETGFPTGSP
jgi:trehalose/maltose transport system substrate-binding protein